MAKVFLKGNEAVAEAAVRSGCRFYAGYPITPQNEIPEYMSRRLPEVGGTFIQGESEIASIQMLYGASGTGTRAMTSSSSCGISLKSEGVSFCASARLPIVYVNMGRGGPGIGSIQPAQMDYMQATKASGNGGFQMLVYSPSTVQEAVDLVYNAFDKAQEYRNPVLILGDGVVATMMEQVELPPERSAEEVKALREKNFSWCLHRRQSLDEQRYEIDAGRWSTLELEERNKAAAAMYEGWKENEVKVEEYLVDDAEVILTAYGISGRIAKSAVDVLRAEGYKAGLIRPITVNPFPYKSFEKLDYNRVKAILDVEMSIPALMVYDVKMAVKDRTPIETCLRSGGNIMNRDDVVAAAKKLFK